MQHTACAAVDCTFDHTLDAADCTFDYTLAAADSDASVGLAAHFACCPFRSGEVHDHYSYHSMLPETSVVTSKQTL